MHFLSKNKSTQQRHFLLFSVLRNELNTEKKKVLRISNHLKDQNSFWEDNYAWVNILLYLTELRFKYSLSPFDSRNCNWVYNKILMYLERHSCQFHQNFNQEYCEMCKPRIMTKTDFTALFVTLNWSEGWSVYYKQNHQP